MKKLIEVILLLLIFLVPLVFTFRGTTYNILKIAAIELFASFIFVLWIVKAYHTRQSRMVHCPLNLPILAYLFWAMASTLWAVNKFEALEVVILQIALIALYFIILNNTRNMETFITVMVGTGSIVSIYGIGQYMGIDWTTPKAAPLVSTLGNVNFTGEYLMMIIPLSAAMVFHQIRHGPCRKPKVLMIVFGIFTILMFVHLLLTKSRASWVGLIGGGIVIFFINPVKKHRLKFLLYLALVTIVALSVIYISSGGSDFFSIKNEAISIFDTRGSSVLFRFFVWRSTFRMIRETPIHGVGAGNFKIIYPLYRSHEEHDISGGDIRVEKAHNDYLGITSELGLIGFGIFVWLLVTVFKVFKKLLEESPQNNAGCSAAIPESILVAGLLVSVVSMLVAAVFGFPFHTPATSLTFWVILGIAGASQAHAMPAGKIHPHPSSTLIPLRSPFTKGGREIVLAGAVIAVCIVSVYVIRVVASDFHLQKVRIYQNAKLWDKTILECEKSIQSCYPNIQAHVFLARALQKQNKMEKAFVELQTILRLHPNHPWTHMWIGNIYLWLNQHDKAVSFLKKAGELNPVYFNNLGLAYLKRNMLDEALSSFKKALIMKAKREITYTHLGIVYEKKGDLDRAILMYRKALEIAPDCEQARRRLETCIEQ